MFTEQQKKMMREQVPEVFIHQLQGFDYLEGHYVITKMNEIFGEDGWSSRVVREGVDKYFTDKDPNRLEGVVNWCVFEIVVNPVLPAEVYRMHEYSEVVRQDIGSSEKALIKADGSVIGGKLKALADNYKSAVTDAMKRTCRQLGTAFGNMLYEGDFIKGDYNRPKNDLGRKKAVEFKMKLQYPLDLQFYLNEIRIAETKDDLGRIFADAKAHWKANDFPAEDVAKDGIIMEEVLKRRDEITPKLEAPKE